MSQSVIDHLIIVLYIIVDDFIERSRREVMKNILDKKYMFNYNPNNLVIIKLMYLASQISEFNLYKYSCKEWFRKCISSYLIIRAEDGSSSKSQ